MLRSAELGVMFKEKEMDLSVRKKGLFKLLAGSLAGIAAGYLLHYMETSGMHINMFYLAAIAAPAAWGLGGLLELIMNRPFSEMEVWWGSLKGWQRGVLGLFVVILSIALMISAVAIAGYFEFN